MFSRRRTRISALLGALLAWLSLNIACGETVQALANEQCDMAASDCCEKGAPKSTCPAGVCGMTCAALLTAQVSDTTVELVPTVTTERFVLGERWAEAFRAPPILPPPR